MWEDYIKTNAVPVAASDGVHYAVTSSNGTLYVDAGTTPVATIHFETNEWKALHQPSQQRAAKNYYDLSGLAAILGEWKDLNRRDHITGARIVWDEPYYVKGYFKWTATDVLPATTYLPQDRYALVANGSGAGWVTLIENDNAGSTNLHLFCHLILLWELAHSLRFFMLSALSVIMSVPLILKP